MLIAEDLLLLLTDDESGKHLVDTSALDLALAGGCLIELAMLGRVDVAADGDQVKAGRLVVRDASPVGEPVLDEALQRVADREGKKPDAVLGSVKKGLRDDLLSRLAGRGVVRAEESKVLGIFPVTRWPAVDQTHDADVREQVVAALVHGTTPDDRTTALVALLSAIDAAPKVAATGGQAVDKRAVRRRAKEIREGEWAAKAVAKAVEAVQAAVMAGVIAATAGASAAASSS